MPKRSATSGPKLQFMHEQDFEDEIALVLAEYGNQHGQVTGPPIPIDEIVEEHFKLVIEYRDLRAEYPEGDVLGAIWFNEKKIAIDQTLVPEDFPAMRGRYRFTLAHELGHWRLHRHLYLHRSNERTLLTAVPTKADHVLRSRQSDPKEFQANRFASCLLMPRELLKRSWHEWRGSMDPIYLDDLRANQQEILMAEMKARGGFKRFDDTVDEMLLLQMSRPLAEKFEVSPDAMRIRLAGLKLLLPKKEPALF